MSVCPSRALLFLTAAGLSKQVSVCGGWSFRADSPECGPDADEGRAVAEAEQNASLASMKWHHAAYVSVHGEYGQDGTRLEVPQAQLSWIIKAT